MIWMFRPDLTRRAGEIATSGQGSETWARLGKVKSEFPPVAEDATRVGHPPDDGCLYALHFDLYAQNRAGEAGGATAAVDADFAAGKGADIESGLAKAGVGFVVFFDCQEAIISESEDVAGEGVALGRVDLDKFKSARLKQFDGFNREPGKIDQRAMVVEKADQRH